MGVLWQDVASINKSFCNFNSDKTGTMHNRRWLVVSIKDDLAAAKLQTNNCLI